MHKQRSNSVYLFAEKKILTSTKGHEYVTKARIFFISPFTNPPTVIFQKEEKNKILFQKLFFYFIHRL